MGAFKREHFSYLNRLNFRGFKFNYVESKAQNSENLLNSAKFDSRKIIEFVSNASVEFMHQFRFLVRTFESDKKHQLYLHPFDCDIAQNKNMKCLT